MAARRSFPHAEIDVIDNSKIDVPASSPASVHAPIFFIFAEKGPFNVPIWGDTTLHQAMFGERTFVERSPYYNFSTIFATETMGRQKCYLVRLRPEDAKLASLVLECTVAPVNLVQYQKDVNGIRLTNEAGDWLPELMADNTTAVTEPGVQLTWSVRPLAVGETFDHLAPKPVVVGGVTHTTYPVLASVGEYEGEAVNRTGFQLYYTPDFDATQTANVKAMTYRFAARKRDVDTGTTTAIRNRFEDAYTDVTLAAESLDTNYDRYIDLAEVIETDFVVQDEDVGARSLLPFKLKVYADHVEAIGQAVLAVSPELSDETAYLVNILSGVDAAGNPYDHAVVGGDGTTVPVGGLSSTTTLYHQGGSDGTLTKANWEALFGAYASGDVYPFIKDTFRFPITHVYDPGMSLAAKKTMLRFFSVSDAVMLQFCTQDVALPPNSQAEDLSVAASLRTQILLHPESAVEGTEAMRAAIYQQVAKRNTTSSYRPYIPILLARLIKRCTTDARTYIVGTPKTRPASEVTIFDDKTINWTPASDDVKQLSWDTGANYVQYCDRNLLFFPDYRSVYPSDVSLLSDELLVDYLVYLKHVIRRRWTYTSGSNEDISSLQDTIARELDSEIVQVFGTKLSAKTSVMQTLRDQQLGYRQTVIVDVRHTPSNRVWGVKIPVSRKDI